MAFITQARAGKLMVEAENGEILCMLIGVGSAYFAMVCEQSE
jgi:hypothetical protein